MNLFELIITVIEVVSAIVLLVAAMINGDKYKELIIWCGYICVSFALIAVVVGLITLFTKYESPCYQ